MINKLTGEIDGLSQSEQVLLFKLKGIIYENQYCSVSFQKDLMDAINDCFNAMAEKRKQISEV